MHQRAYSTFSLLLLLAAGCGASNASGRYMAEMTPPRPLVPPADAALVVFVRPSAYAFGIGANVLDERGRFLGDSTARGHFVAVMPPGKHMFVVWAENTDAVAADLLPGRIYFVEVAPTMGAWSAQMHLYAIKPADGARRDQWMRDTKQFVVSDGAAAQSKLDARGGDVQERLRRAQEHLGKYDAAERARHTLDPADGI
jgi:hypothetical protein